MKLKLIYSRNFAGTWFQVNNRNFRKSVSEPDRWSPRRDNETRRKAGEEEIFFHPAGWAAQAEQAEHADAC